MDTFKSLLCAAVVVALLTVAPGVYSGLRSSRWRSSEDLQLAAATLDALPQQIGAWICTKSTPLSEDARDVLKYEASLSRTYSNQNDSSTLQCILIVGLPGPIVRHPPEFCYGVNENVEIDHKVVAFDSGLVEHAVRLTRFEEPKLLKSQFFVATGWFANSHLGTSEVPRMTYGGEPFIYAFQVMWPINGNLEDCESRGISFLKDLMPAFQKNCVEPSEIREENRST